MTRFSDLAGALRADTAPPTESLSELDGAAEADVAIVGACHSGLSTALEQAQGAGSALP